MSNLKTFHMRNCHYTNNNACIRNEVTSRERENADQRDG
jgi:hypothetical protein